MYSLEKLAIFSFFSLALLSQSYFYENAWAQGSEISIPDWIKTTSGWWAEGMVTDKEFVDGIEFMVKNEFIKSPTIKVVESSDSSQQTQTGEIVVPEWIKNNAGWWAEGMISDSDFVSGIEFMIKNQFISSPNISIIDASVSEVEEKKETKPEGEEKQQGYTKFAPIEREGQPEPTGSGVTVLMIDGKSYPLVQFWSSETSKCDDNEVWRTDTGKAVDVEGDSLDEATDGCRFGLVLEIEKDKVQMTSEQITKFEELTGLKITTE